jgi:hypothetical protein
LLLIQLRKEKNEAERGVISFGDDIETVQNNNMSKFNI